MLAGSAPRLWPPHPHPSPNTSSAPTPQQHPPAGATRTRVQHNLSASGRENPPGRCHHVAGGWSLRLLAPLLLLPAGRRRRALKPAERLRAGAARCARRRPQWQRQHKAAVILRLREAHRAGAGGHAGAAAELQAARHRRVQEQLDVPAAAGDGDLPGVVVQLDLPAAQRRAVLRVCLQGAGGGCARSARGGRSSAARLPRQSAKPAFLGAKPANPLLCTSRPPPWATPRLKNVLPDAPYLLHSPPPQSERNQHARQAGPAGLTRALPRGPTRLHSAAVRVDRQVAVQAVDGDAAARGAQRRHAASTVHVGHVDWAPTWEEHENVCVEICVSVASCL